MLRRRDEFIVLTIYEDLIFYRICYTFKGINLMAAERDTEIAGNHIYDNIYDTNIICNSA